MVDRDQAELAGQLDPSAVRQLVGVEPAAQADGAEVITVEDIARAAGVSVRMRPFKNVLALTGASPGLAIARPAASIQLMVRTPGITAASSTSWSTTRASRSTRRSRR